MEVNIWVQLIVILVTNAATFLTTRKRYNADTASVENQNIQTILEIYKREIEYMEKRTKENEEKIEALKNKVETLVNENINLRSILSDVENKLGKPLRTKKA